jgi:hypothetical protein
MNTNPVTHSPVTTHRILTRRTTISFILLSATRREDCGFVDA